MPPRSIEDMDEDMGQNLALFLSDLKSETEKETKKTAEESQEGTRSLTTLIIIILYVASVALLVVASLWIATFGDPERLINLKLTDDLIKGLLLPVVTFVLGFYYAGKS
jgi:hypothetical protein